MEAPKIGIVIPCYKAEEYLYTAVNSVYKQVYTGIIDCIVVNDGSDKKDLSKSIVERFKGKGMNIEYLDQINGGVGNARNNGRKLLKDCKYLIFLDADDFLPDNYVAETVATAEIENVDVVYTGWEYFGHGQGVFYPLPYHNLRLRAENMIHASALIKAESFDYVNGYNENFARCYIFEDWELWLRMAKEGFSFSRNFDTFLNYRQKEVSRNKVSKDKYMATIRALRLKFNDYFLG